MWSRSTSITDSDDLTQYTLTSEDGQRDTTHKVIYNKYTLPIRGPIKMQWPMKTPCLFLMAHEYCILNDSWKTCALRGHIFHGPFKTCELMMNTHFMAHEKLVEHPKGLFMTHENLWTFGFSCGMFGFSVSSDTNSSPRPKDFNFSWDKAWMLHDKGLSKDFVSMCSACMYLCSSEGLKLPPSCSQKHCFV